MRLEKKHDEELARRKGLTGKTVIQVVWLLVTGVLAYFFVNYLFSEGIITPGIFYNQLFIPRSVPEIGLKLIVVFGFVIVMQIVFSIGYIVASPEGRRRTGDASMHSRNKDPFDDRFG
ncbi:MAG: hypothetical protein H6654_19310 [Ardenticatenaceae bacterium]|nr:hypothetical protein [Anaerolineales bacterium]MCB8939500.1 hypothetical protein [Ardenticatenaceae bacterium]MCB8975716.1 hypothetical protein [Ardenticatenaceae bacterium]